MQAERPAYANRSEPLETIEQLRAQLATEREKHRQQQQQQQELQQQQKLEQTLRTLVLADMLALSVLQGPAPRAMPATSSDGPGPALRVS